MIQLDHTNAEMRTAMADAMKYWLTEFDIDGFRFDLASILGRNEDGSPMERPPLVESLAYEKGDLVERRLRSGLHGSF